MIRHQHNAVGMRHNAALDFRLKKSGVAQTVFHRDAGGAHECLADAQVGQGIEGGDADERAGRGVELSAQRDQTEIVELCRLVHCGERMGHNRDVAAVCEVTKHTDGGGAGVEENRVAVLDQCGGQRADLLLSVRVDARADGERRDILGDDRSDAAVYLGNAAAGLQLAQVAPDGIFGYLKDVAQLVDAGGLIGKHVFFNCI